MHAVFLTTDFPPDRGGLQTYASRIASGLACDLWVEAARPRSGPPFLPPDATRFRFHAGRSRWGALPWSLLAALRHMLAGRKILLHLQWSTALGSWLLRGAGARYAVLVHGAELLDRGPLRRALRRLLLDGASRVVAGSLAAADWARAQGVPEARLRIVHYGCDATTADPGSPPEGPPRLACLHRLVPRKGTALLLRALSGLRRRDWTLDIAGDGPEKPALQRLASESGLSDRVRFLGSISEEAKPDFYRACHLFLLPSLPPTGNDYAEGLGLVLLEAQAAGRPVLAARTGGIPEALREGVTGELFRAGDVYDLRARLESLLDDPARLAAMGRQGPAFVAEHFSWDKTLRGLEAVLEEMRRE